jgi:cytochrome oxidase Cu insertion factor (SCO1/SenC/PrrC family)
MFCPYPSMFDKRAGDAVPARAEAGPGQASAAGSAAGINEPSAGPPGSGAEWNGTLANPDGPAGRARPFARRRDSNRNKSARGLTASRAWRMLSLLLFAAGLLSCRTTALASALETDLSGTGDHDYDAPAPGTYSLPVVKAAADGEVLDSAGRALRLRELTHGRVTVLSFIYTRCAAAKACPYATGVLNQLHRFSQEEPALAREMRLVSLSFDPENDTPERMAAYSAWARERSNAAQWRFVTTRGQTELRPILEAYGQAVDRKKNPYDPTGPLNHMLRVFLIDREGNIRNIYSSATLDPRLVLADVKTLLVERAPASASGNRAAN